MLLEITCNYCNYKWEKNLYMKESIAAEICPSCKDTNLKVKDYNQDKIDYYVGSPPFKDKEEEKDDNTDFNYDTYI